MTTSNLRFDSSSVAILLVIAGPVKAATSDTAIDAKTTSMLCEAAITSNRTPCFWLVGSVYLPIEE